MPLAGLRAWVFDPRLLMCSGMGVAASAGHRVTEQQAAERREQGGLAADEIRIVTMPRRFTRY